MLHNIFYKVCISLVLLSFWELKEFCYFWVAQVFGRPNSMVPNKVLLKWHFSPTFQSKILAQPLIHAAILWKIIKDFIVSFLHSLLALFSLFFSIVVGLTLEIVGKQTHKAYSKFFELSQHYNNHIPIPTTYLKASLKMPQSRPYGHRISWKAIKFFNPISFSSNLIFSLKCSFHTILVSVIDRISHTLYLLPAITFIFPYPLRKYMVKG